MDLEVVGKGLSGLGKHIGPALIAKAKEMGVQLPAEVKDSHNPPPQLIIPVLRQIAGYFFPLLAVDAERKKSV
jgi:hypothetical protein